MADSSMDVAAANRFISSLSKSLQALCHGCMDFDAGIEIVGYINVNIDSGSKVDYVLNEKVLKSTTNSMTFVSNSFLAKKDQPKQCRDGSCSPILELNQPTPPTFHHRARGGYSYPASQHYRSSSIYSPHSQVLRGSQKRAWNGPERDWRSSPRKYPRDTRPQHNMYSQQSSNVTFDQSLSNTIPSGSNFLTTQTETDSSLQSDVNIKKELEDGSENATDQDVSNQACRDNTNNETLPENVNVKQDPDSIPIEEGVSKFENSTEALAKADLSSSFLQQPPTEGESQTHLDIPDKSKSEMASADESNTGATEYDNSSNVDVQSGEKYADDPDNTGTGEGDEESAGMDAEYEGSGEDIYSQPSFSGEGSSGGGPFEVIEIDDEDEDVQAMFQDAHGPGWTSYGTGPRQPSDAQSRWTSVTAGNKAYFYIEDDQMGKVPFGFVDTSTKTFTVTCVECGKVYRSVSGARAHFKIKHCGTFDYYCDICTKGFQQQSHLKCHMALHSQQKQYECRICGLKYAHKTSLTAHLKASHGHST